MKTYFLWFALLLFLPATVSAQSLTLYNVTYTAEVRGDEVWLHMLLLTDSCIGFPEPMIWERVPGGVATRTFLHDICEPSTAGDEIVAYIGQFEAGTHTWFLHGCGFGADGWECSEYGQLVFQVPSIKVATVPSGGPAANFGLGGLLLFLAWLALRFGRKPID